MSSIPVHGALEYQPWASCSHPCGSFTKRYKLVTALQGVAEVTAGLAESNGSLPSGLWRDSLHVTCNWLPVHLDQLRAQRSVTSMGELYHSLQWTATLFWIGSGSVQGKEDSVKDQKIPTWVHKFTFVSHYEYDYTVVFITDCISKGGSAIVVVLIVSFDYSLEMNRLL